MEELEIYIETENNQEQEINLLSENISYAGGTSNYLDLENKPTINGIELKGDKTTEDLGIIDDVQVDGKSVVTNGIANINLSSLEKTLQDILTIIQGEELDELTISKIEELIVSYFESKTIKEVEE